MFIEVVRIVVVAVVGVAVVGVAVVAADGLRPLRAGARH